MHGQDYLYVCLLGVAMNKIGIDVERVALDVDEQWFSTHLLNDVNG